MIIRKCEFSGKERRFMGIDQSILHTGVTIISASPTGNYIMYANGVRVDEGIAAELRIYGIVNVLENLIKDYEVDAVALEGLAYNMGGTNSARVLGGLFFCILGKLIEMRIPYEILPPKTVKKFATNSGNAKKDEMIEHIPSDDLNILAKLTGLKIESKKFTDIADSYWICRRLIKDRKK